MLFGMSRGSDGFGSERYLAYLPFEVAIGATIATPTTLDLGDGSNVRLVRLTHLYAVLAGPYGTEAEAEQCLCKLEAAVAWIALTYRIGTKPATEVRPVAFWQKPTLIVTNPNYGFLVDVGWEHADGYYDAEVACVIPDHKRLIRHEAGRVSVSIGLSAQNWATEFGRALACPRIFDVTSDENLMLSIDLYSESKGLLIPRARFLTLVTALEALLPDIEISAEAKVVLNDIKITAKAARDGNVKDTESWQDLDVLLSRIGELKRQSVGSSLRQFIRRMASSHPNSANRPQ